MTALARARALDGGRHAPDPPAPVRLLARRRRRWPSWPTTRSRSSSGGASSRASASSRSRRSSTTSTWAPSSTSCTPPGRSGGRADPQGRACPRLARDRVHPTSPDVDLPDDPTMADVLARRTRRRPGAGRASRPGGAARTARGRSTSFASRSGASTPTCAPWAMRSIPRGAHAIEPELRAVVDAAGRCARPRRPDRAACGRDARRGDGRRARPAVRDARAPPDERPCQASTSMLDGDAYVDAARRARRGGRVAARRARRRRRVPQSRCRRSPSAPGAGSSVVPTNSGPDSPVDDFHRVRIAAKRARYAVDLAARMPRRRHRLRRRRVWRARSPVCRTSSAPSRTPPSPRRRSARSCRRGRRAHLRLRGRPARRAAAHRARRRRVPAFLEAWPRVRRRRWRKWASERAAHPRRRRRRVATQASPDRRRGRRHPPAALRRLEPAQGQGRERRVRPRGRRARGPRGDRLPRAGRALAGRDALRQVLDRGACARRSCAGGRCRPRRAPSRPRARSTSSSGSPWPRPRTASAATPTARCSSASRAVPAPTRTVLLVRHAIGRQQLESGPATTATDRSTPAASRRPTSWSGILSRFEVGHDRVGRRAPLHRHRPAAGRCVRARDRSRDARCRRSAIPGARTKPRPGPARPRATRSTTRSPAARARSIPDLLDAHGHGRRLRLDDRAARRRARPGRSASTRTVGSSPSTTSSARAARLRRRNALAGRRGVSRRRGEPRSRTLSRRPPPS